MNYYHKIKMQKKKTCIEQKYIRLIYGRKKLHCRWLVTLNCEDQECDSQI